MKLSSIHRLGLLHQKLRSTDSVTEKLSALREYEPYMDEIETDAFASYQEMEAVQRGKNSA